MTLVMTIMVANMLMSQVALALHGLNINKASGPDLVTKLFLKEFAFLLAEPVCVMFNLSRMQRTFPQLWKSAEVIPIPNVNPPRSIDLLLPTFAKVLESIVGRWFLNIILPTIDPNQFGALQGRSTITLVSILHQWCSTVDAGGSVRAAFVDFAKACDRVDHNLLVTKFLAKGVSHCMPRQVAPLMLE